MRRQVERGWQRSRVRFAVTAPWPAPSWLGGCRLAAARFRHFRKGIASTTTTTIPPVRSTASAPWPTAAWHLPTRCTEGDVNALFEFNGVWHIMSQWALRPQTSVGHMVSTDLLHWTRLPDALSSGSAADEQCFDGSVSLVELDGELQPMLMIDGGCGRKGPGSLPCMESSGNGSTGGVTAVASNLSDLSLTNWTKRGPTLFEGCAGSSGPSPIWRNPLTGVHNLIAIAGRAEARFEALDPSLTRWRVVDHAFIGQRGGGGGLWHELPPNVDAAPDDPRWPTHIFQANGVEGDGRATFILGVYHPQNETFANVTAPAPLDLGSEVAYGQLSAYRPSTSGAGPREAERVQHVQRVLHVSWLVGPRAPDCLGGGQLTSLRDVRFDPRLDRLVETPIAEYLQLRRGLLFNHTRVRLAAGAPAAVLHGQSSPVFDAELSVAVTAGAALTLALRCAAADDACSDGANLTLAFVGKRSGEATRSVQVSVGGRQATFQLLPAEARVPIRAMSDRRSLEFFVGGGRAVYSTTLLSQAAQVRAHATGADVEVSAAGWAMAPTVNFDVNRFYPKTPLSCNFFPLVIPGARSFIRKPTPVSGRIHSRLVLHLQLTRCSETPSRRQRSRTHCPNRISTT